MTDNTQSGSPTNDKTQLGATLVPNGQSSTSAVGGALGVVFIMICHNKGLDFPAGAEASIAVLFMAAASYLHDFLQVLLDKLKRS
jgi:hypothetical protein